MTGRVIKLLVPSLVHSYDKQLSATATNTIVCGDFNRPGINWDDMTSDKHGERFLECSMDLLESGQVSSECQ